MFRSSGLRVMLGSFKGFIGVPLRGPLRDPMGVPLRDPLRDL